VQVQPPDTGYNCVNRFTDEKRGESAMIEADSCVRARLMAVGHRPAGRRRTAIILGSLTLALALASHGQAQSFDAARDAGVQLPPRLGITLTVYNQRQDYDIVSLDVGIPGIDLSQADGLKVDNTTDTTHLMVDYWVLPFLNVFALGGTVGGKTRVSLANIDLGVPLQLNDLRIDYHGTVYGGGFTLAGGWQRTFESLTYEYTKTSLNVTTSSIKAWVATLKLGYQVNGGAVWVGAMYQDTQEHDQGAYTMPYFGTFPFKVDFKQAKPLNYLLGATAGIGQHWILTMEAGFGDRDSAMLTLGYRY